MLRVEGAQAGVDSRPGPSACSGGEESADGGVGRKNSSKAIVAIAVESMPHEPRFGPVRMRRIPDTRHSTLVRFIRWAIRPGSVVHTDAWSGYRGLPRHFYLHEIHNLSDEDAGRSVEDLPTVHRVTSLLKRWLLGPHHGAVS